MRKIIIDTDPGVDDAMAIFYALASPELDVIGLTTVFGNASTDICATNALRLLEIAGRADSSVATGATRPLAQPFRGGADFVHGADGSISSCCKHAWKAGKFYWSAGKRDWKRRSAACSAATHVTGLRTIVDFRFNRKLKRYQYPLLRGYFYDCPGKRCPS